MSSISLTDLEGRSTENLQELLDWRKHGIQLIENMNSRNDHSQDDFKQTLISDMQRIQIVLASRR